MVGASSDCLPDAKVAPELRTLSLDKVREMAARDRRRLKSLVDDAAEGWRRISLVEEAVEGRRRSAPPPDGASDWEDRRDPSASLREEFDNCLV